MCRPNKSCHIAITLSSQIMTCITWTPHKRKPSYLQKLNKEIKKFGNWDIIIKINKIDKFDHLKDKYYFLLKLDWKGLNMLFQNF